MKIIFQNWRKITMCKVGDMVIMQQGGSYCNNNTVLRLLEVKRVTKTLVICGKYNDKELYKFKKCKDNFRSSIARASTGKLTSDHILYDISNKEIIKKHLELSLNEIFDKAKGNLIEQIKNSINTFDDYYYIENTINKLMEGNKNV
jgi:hypothetical protein